ncbi:MAG: hypothetical protein IKX18_05415 [Muribaculaceae bacterium]|nr:hypothetical protein [Muribaculaceae bacterium]MBR5685575.1 hypothetical protein [Muribaculaceae bacterium]
MKKITLLSLCLMFFSMVFVSCAEHDLNYYVEGFKGEMPEDLGGGMQMTDVNIVDDFVQVEVTNDESELDLSSAFIGAALSAVAEPMKAEFFEGSGMKDFMQACSNEGKGFRMVINGTKSGKTVTLFEVTQEEMNEKYPPKAKE